MRDLSALTHADFEACVGQPFALASEEIALELVEVEKRGTFEAEVHKRQAFSAIFRGPPESVLEQRIYALNNATLGEVELFLVSLGPDAAGMLYEAVFT